MKHKEWRESFFNPNLKEGRRCKFERPWLGKCQNLAGDDGFCDEHSGMECASCGDQATHSCGETGQFVCGAPLCDKCEHAIFPDGTNGGVGFNAQGLPKGMKMHCRKTEQKYKPWYARKRMAGAKK